ncbi:hypothetical protein GS16_05460 [Candidatus Liberibacter solanacearum]|nr:hypothetical protein GS16_05460 [Candidatus Liberibacter solanacearum]
MVAVVEYIFLKWEDRYFIPNHCLIFYQFSLLIESAALFSKDNFMISSLWLGPSGNKDEYI